MNIFKHFMPSEYLDFNKPNSKGETPLMLAIDNYYLETFSNKGKLLKFVVEQGADPNLPSSRGFSANQYLVDKQDEESINMITIIEGARRRHSLQNAPTREFTSFSTLERAQHYFFQQPASTRERKRDKLIGFFRKDRSAENIDSSSTSNETGHTTFKKPPS
jgi:hypothetical protein